MEENEKKNIEIIPALLPEDFAHLEEEIHLVEKAIKTSAGFVQIDVVDGKFAPTKTWPYNKKDQEKWNLIKSQKNGLPAWENVDFEIDLMLENQLEEAKNWISAGAKRLIFHIEGFTDELNSTMDEILKLKTDFAIEIVLSLNPSTDEGLLDPYLEKIDGVQFMGNDKIGYHGVKLDESILPKIKKLRQKMPNLPIGIDIGVKEETIGLLAKAGVTRFSSGSAILGAENPKEAIQDFLEIARNHQK